LTNWPAVTNWPVVDDQANGDGLPMPTVCQWRRSANDDDLANGGDQAGGGDPPA